MLQSFSDHAGTKPQQETRTQRGHLSSCHRVFATPLQSELSAWPFAWHSLGCRLSVTACSHASSLTPCRPVHAASDPRTPATALQRSCLSVPASKGSTRGPRRRLSVTFAAEPAAPASPYPAVDTPASAQAVQAELMHLQDLCMVRCACQTQMSGATLCAQGRSQQPWLSVPPGGRLDT